MSSTTRFPSRHHARRVAENGDRVFESVLDDVYNGQDIMLVFETALPPATLPPRPSSHSIKFLRLNTPPGDFLEGPPDNQGIIRDVTQLRPLNDAAMWYLD